MFRALPRFWRDNTIRWCASLSIFKRWVRDRTRFRAEELSLGERCARLFDSHLVSCAAFKSVVHRTLALLASPTITVGRSTTWHSIVLNAWPATSLLRQRLSANCGLPVGWNPHRFRHRERPLRFERIPSSFIQWRRCRQLVWATANAAGDKVKHQPCDRIMVWRDGFRTDYELQNDTCIDMPFTCDFYRVWNV